MARPPTSGANSVPNLQIEADLSCDLDGKSITVNAYDDEIVVNVGDWTSMMSLAKIFRPLIQRNRKLVIAAFERTESTMTFKVNDRNVFRLGYGVHSSLLRFGGWLPVRMYPIGIVSTVFRLRPS